MQNTSPKTSPEQQEKAKLYRYYKRVATGLLILMTLIFILAKIGESQYPVLAYIRAFSEAAMIGALADWFAVTALFRHPLGLPIPHTNLIVSNQEAIGNNLGNFVTTNFLSDETIEEKLRTLKVSAAVGKWLTETENAELIVQEVARLVPQMLAGLDDEKINELVRQKALQFGHELDFSKLVSDTLAYFTLKEQHQNFLTAAIGMGKTYLQNPVNRRWIENVIKEHSPRYVPDFVNTLIIDRIIESAQSLLQDVENDPDHKIRTEFDKLAEELIHSLRTSPAYKTRIEEIKADMLQGAAFQNAMNGIWPNIKNEILKGIEQPNSRLRQEMVALCQKAGSKILENAELQARIDQFLRVELTDLLRRNRNWISDHIGQTVKNWDKREVADKLELEVGKDLQFIRINGTLVGGIVGLLIYTIFEFLL